MKLKPCPCGKTPKSLNVTDGYTTKYSYVSGDCCGEWDVEFRTNYHPQGSEKLMKLATEAWNDATRGTQ